MAKKKPIATIDDIEDIYYGKKSCEEFSKINPNVQDENGNTVWHKNPYWLLREDAALRLAQAFGFKATVDLNKKNNQGVSVLSLLIDNNTDPYFFIDSEKRARCSNLDYTTQNREGISLLMSVLKQGKGEKDIPTIEYLCHHPEILNLQDKCGNTALHYACQEEFNPSAHVIRTLLHFGADITIKNNLGLSPMDVATKDTVNILAPYMPKEVEGQQNSTDRLNKEVIGLLMGLVKSIPLNKKQQQILNQAENILNSMNDTPQPTCIVKSSVQKSAPQHSNGRAE